MLELTVTALAGPLPHYDGDRQGTFLPFLDAPGEDSRIQHPPRLGLSFGDEMHPVLMDTGSTGIVVSASRIPDVDALPSKPGRLTYSSSGRIMIGRWVTIPVTVWGRNGAGVATRPIPVLAVDRIDCTDRPRHCRPEEAPRHVAMMGVGFGREDDSQAQSTPETNPLLNLAPSGTGAARRGYVVTKQGVHVGLTSANTRGNFRFVKLDPHLTIPGEWRGVPVCIGVNDRAPATCGRALLDTGVAAMFLTLPPEQVADRVEGDGHSGLLPGTQLSFSFPDTAAPAARYQVVVGDAASPLAPERVVLNTTRPMPFVNTGLRILNGFDLLYDADSGWFAFRARGGQDRQPRP
ncbi:hypothetical protein OPKNFCMD_6843 [Methylobacterium crusticola]|uniref:Peptidase A2 domain-containing protein n=1 Tax=Methylobacterium crusticola TaxID=1697972 RepID=A0ABQ4R9H8_9HYPH|nr:hypothetical protein [Methylobacterium crusticola]GJD54062.1 hypothetical protein OPKNFCMD_6843 [Methylobacterium crusticola]